MNSKSLNLAPASVEDYRTLAEKRLPRQFFDYIDGGAYQEITARSNISAFDKLLLRQRVLNNVESINTSCELFGEQLDLPLALGPVGLTGVFARRGEKQAYEAATRVGVPFSLSTVSICPIEELAGSNSKRPFWFQLYVIRDREYAKRLLQRAEDAGCSTLLFTVDLAVVGERYRDIRNGLNGGTGLGGALKRGLDLISHPGWLWDVPIRGKPLTFGNLSEAVPDASSLTDFKTWVDHQFDPSVTWDDLSWIREHWKGKLVIKGILDSEDAEKAVALGADGIVVSNHGGRQLDGAPSSLEALPAIARRVNKRCKILFDGGIRSGADIVKAIALGADTCLIGRAWAYALAAKGEQGVYDMLCAMKQQMHVTMALTGITQIEQIGPEILYQNQSVLP